MNIKGNKKIYISIVVFLTILCAIAIVSIIFYRNIQIKNFISKRRIY